MSQLHYIQIQIRIVRINTAAARRYAYRIQSRGILSSRCRGSYSNCGFSELWLLIYVHTEIVIFWPDFFSSGLLYFLNIFYSTRSVISMQKTSEIRSEKDIKNNDISPLERRNRVVFDSVNLKWEIIRTFKWAWIWREMCLPSRK